MDLLAPLNELVPCVGLGEVDAVLVGQLLHLGVHLVVGGLQTLGLDDGLHGQIHADLLLSGAVGLRQEVGLGGAGHLQILVKGDALRGQLLLEVVGHLLSLQIHHGIGDIAGDALGHLLHQHVLEGPLSGLLALPGDLLLQIGLQLLQGVELGDVLGKLVVDGGHVLGLDLVDLHVEDDGLAGELRGCSSPGKVMSMSFSSPAFMPMT